MDGWIIITISAVLCVCWVLASVFGSVKYPSWILYSLLHYWQLMLPVMPVRNFFTVLLYFHFPAFGFNNKTLTFTSWKCRVNLIMVGILPTCLTWFQSKHDLLCETTGLNVCLFVCLFFFFWGGGYVLQKIISCWLSLNTQQLKSTMAESYAYSVIFKG